MSSPQPFYTTNAAELGITGQQMGWDRALTDLEIAGVSGYPHIVGFSNAWGGNCGGTCNTELTLPAHTDGDLLVVSRQANIDVGPIPTGWTFQGQDFYTKVASGEGPTIDFDYEGRYQALNCWAIRGSDNAIYDVQGNSSGGAPSATFTGPGLVLAGFAGYGDASSVFRPCVVTDSNNNIGTPWGVYNFCGGHYLQTAAGGPTNMYWPGQIVVASGGDEKKVTIHLARFQAAP